MSIDKLKKHSYTQKQGQYLAFIYYYTKINGIAPAQIDFQKYFRVKPPTVHQMIVKLEKEGLITRVLNKPRTIKLAIANESIPKLE